MAFNQERLYWMKRCILKVNFVIIFIFDFFKQQGW